MMPWAGGWRASSTSPTATAWSWPRPSGPGPLTRDATVSRWNAERLSRVKGYAGLEPIMELDVPGAGYSRTTALARAFVWGANFCEPVALIDYTDAGDVPGAGTPGGGGC
jgi:hypothetical protein